MTQPRLLGGRYELDGVVGRGGMAEVYRARDIRLDRQVAVKTLRADLARDPTFQARFRREAQSAASLNNPSIIAVYDTGEDTDQYGTSIPYIVMEYVDGKTLREMLQADRRLLPERAAEIVDGTLRALDYSHKAGIVHRDIKPANVMLTRAGDVRVMDFGIARAMDDNQATMTQTAQVIGTAQYLSPEQARGERVDARSDIYSTGCMFYELLTGQPPFTGDSPVAIAYQHVREDPVPPSHIDPEIPQWADAIVLKAMAKDPNDRYQDSAEMRADIQRAMSGMPLAAPTMVGAGATQAIGQTQMAPATGGLPPYQYGDPEDDLGGSGRGKKIALWTLLAVLIIGGAALAGYFLLGSGGADKTDVPTVAGETQAAAVATLKSSNLSSSVKYGYSDQVGKGKVFKSDPAEGTTVDANSTVTIFVSKGQQQVEVPRVAGQPSSDAEKTLSDAGLTVETVNKHSTRVSEGDVIGTDPKAGSKVAKNSSIKMYVSSGIKQVPVPNVTGLSKAAAESKLNAANLQVQTHTVTTDQGQPGTVFRQTPSSGSVPAKSTVTIYVAKAPNPSPTTSQPTPPDTNTPGPNPTDSGPHWPWNNGNG
ncbi:MAG TPA: Stk1 family PASTA domain-containing Ser/Thr kinase [Streptosporangiaceae bacterium]